MDLNGFPHLEGRIDALLRGGALDAKRVEQREILPEAVFPPRPKLISGTEGQTERWIMRQQRSEPEVAATAVNCYAIEDVRISGIGHVHIGGKLIVSPETLPAYWLHKLKQDWAGLPASEAALPVRRIAGETVAFAGWGTKVYGHLLVEMLPRLLIARRFLGERFAGAQFLMPADAPSWFAPMLNQALGIAARRIVRYHPTREQVELERGIVPALPFQQHGFHPGLNPLMDAMRDAVIGVDPPALAARLFMTRALFANPETEQRRCMNELRLAEIAARDYGCAVIAPETLPWPMQVQLMAGARIVAGEFGSALHGTLFSRPGTRVASIGIANLTQTMIASLRRQEIAYMPTPLPNSLALYPIDEWAFRRFMDAVMR